MPSCISTVPVSTMYNSSYIKLISKWYIFQSCNIDLIKQEKKLKTTTKLGDKVKDLCACHVKVKEHLKCSSQFKIWQLITANDSIQSFLQETKWHMMKAVAFILINLLDSCITWNEQALCLQITYSTFFAHAIHYFIYKPFRTLLFFFGLTVYLFASLLINEASILYLKSLNLLKTSKCFKSNVK